MLSHPHKHILFLIFICTHARHALSVSHSHILRYTGTRTHSCSISYSYSLSLYNSFLHAHTASLSHKCTLHLSYSFIHAHTPFLSLFLSHTQTEKKQKTERKSPQIRLVNVFDPEKSVSKTRSEPTKPYILAVIVAYVLATIPPITSLAD